jgi:membrane-bound lytic murein transglycosylase D
MERVLCNETGHLQGRGFLMKLITLCLLALLFTACASLKKSTESVTSIGTESSVVHPEALTSMRNSDPAPPDMMVPEFDNVPEAVQPSVDKWLQYFKGKGREHMERYLSRSTRYEKLMKKILRQNGLPEDIIYIALIESGFSPRAISRAAAVGYWQFIRGTGKRYGLQINSFIDERRDPEIATQAAADYFKELYGEFNSWFLAMASYNVGEGRVRREIKRNKTNDFWVLAKKRRIPKETVNYVPKYLAARLIAKDPEKYGFKDIPYETPIEFETVTIENPVNIRKMAEKMNIDYPELKRLNPKYRGEVAPLDGNKTVMRVPLTTTEIAKTAALEAAVKDMVFVADRGETDVYKVRPGDTLNRIARRFKTNVGMIKDLNELKRGARLQPGRTIFVPLRVTESAQWETAQRKASQLPAKVVASAASTNSTTTINTGTETNNIVDTNVAKPTTSSSATLPIAQIDSTTNINTIDEAIYIVQEGESLAEVSLKNNMTMAELMELNNFTEGDSVKVGMQLRVKKLQPDQGEPSIDVALIQSADVKSESLDLPSSPKSKISNAEVLVAATMPSATAATNEAAIVKLDSKPETKTESGTEAKTEVKSEVKAIIEQPGVNTGESDLATDTVSSVRKHLVKNGETLYRIAKMYGTTIGALKRANNMKRRKNRIRVGTTLIIPESEVDSSDGMKSNEGLLKSGSNLKRKV